jgi:hypothetical protein
MQKGWVILFVVLGLIMSFACAGTHATSEKAVTLHKKRVEKHPSLTEQEKLVVCSACHKDATPQVYKEWYNSRHGIGNVKCFQCHGTFEDFHVTPPMIKCEACHSKEVTSATTKKACWECHSPHAFGHLARVHKGHK